MSVLCLESKNRTCHALPLHDFGPCAQTDALTFVPCAIQGTIPPLQEALELHSILSQSDTNLRQPVGLEEQLLQGRMGSDVGQSMLLMLQARTTSHCANKPPCADNLYLTVLHKGRSCVQLKSPPLSNLPHCFIANAMTPMQTAQTMYARTTSGKTTQ